jgi:hypothetical protein
VDGPGGAAALRRVSGGGKIPTFVIDGAVRTGFSPAGVSAMIRQAARRRTGGR